MTEHPKSTDPSLIPPQEMPEGVETFSRQVHGLLDGQPKDEATVSEALTGMDDVLDAIALRLYSMASMLVGEGEEGIQLVETAVARTELSPCGDAVQARQSSRRALCEAAIEKIASRDSSSLAPPDDLEPSATCIEEDDLSAAGISSDELETLLSGPNRDAARKWVASLATDVRVVFVLRAVAGFTSDESADMLAQHGGPKASGWTADGVRILFRQGLCSLASQLIQSSAH